MVDVLEYIYGALDDGNYVIGVYIDFKKSFDLVSHDILLQKLQHHGIGGLALNWFSSYLHDRKQFVSVNGTNSDLQAICQFGVPQGSILGPLLFLIFINDIHTSIECSKIKLFADDTNCFFSGKDFENLRETVVREVSSLQHWANANKLTINFDSQKSCFSIFKPLNSQLPESSDDGLQIFGNTLTHQNKTTYLGVVLDHNLSWEFHIHDLNKKLVKYAGIFSKIRYILPSNCRIILYNAFVFSRLNYGIELYANLNSRSHLYPLTVNQNKILKILQFKKHRSNTNALY